MQWMREHEDTKMTLRCWRELLGSDMGLGECTGMKLNNRESIGMCWLEMPWITKEKQLRLIVYFTVRQSEF